ncbi:MAG: bifunctional diaminohydroxyphosphoribosylaminopyrimidine deaminase/5-amino-6-(5-phosphoribosylamino)uracil reductase RibD [Spirochaetaceae bacterium]|nr:MAG: bifunctional diaminohydroxyphosphoribosylaminopyrimidine deaminase/5-amino-6-(5-phosphoribosylamino)uracil reductase RibD [Spirochaetaceae bacterium]
MEHDRSYMERALLLARRGLGHTRPNPAVGAVLVRDGNVIGEGYHQRAGGPHAEVAAIESAREPVRGATLYCTLEPCCHEGPHKRTPPCTRRIIAEGISRVVIATQDPNPQVNGRGVQILRAAGIDVSVGMLRREAAFLNEAFFASVQLGRPLVHLKAAQTLDGYLATTNGHSQWITDIEARTEAHQLRAEADAVVVGAGTVFADDPLLTVRHVNGSQPIRVVVAGSRPIPPSSNILSGDDPTIVFTPENGTTLVDLRSMLDQLYRQGITSVLVEGGAALLSSFLQQGLWDKVTLFTAFRLLGGGQSTFRGLGRSHIQDGDQLQFPTVRRLGNGLMIQGYRDALELFGAEVIGASAEAESLSPGAAPGLQEVLSVYGNR